MTGKLRCSLNKPDDSVLATVEFRRGGRHHVCVRRSDEIVAPLVRQLALSCCPISVGGSTNRQAIVKRMAGIVYPGAADGSDEVAS